MSARALFVLALVALATPSDAGEFITGTEVLQGLKGELSEDDGVRNYSLAFSMGYIIGVADAANSLSSCTPEAATMAQTIEVVQVWLEAHPAERHLSADRHVTSALAQAWPCEDDVELAPAVIR